MIRGALILACIGCVTVLSAHAPVPQAAPAFEVASVRKSSGRSSTAVVLGTGGLVGGLDQTGTLAGFVLYAFDLRDHQLIGGPDWVRTERFEISARAGRLVLVAELRLMMRSLLQERFKLRFHREQRPRTIYELVRSSRDRLGPNLTQNADDCKSTVNRPANVPAGANTLTGCGSIASVANIASLMMETSVVDRTGLTGNFAYAMFFTPDGPRSVGGALLPRQDSPSDTNAPSFITALQEQLGLRLQPSRAQVEVVVIDSAEMPTPN